jgi:hypothetical protein
MEGCFSPWDIQASSYLAVAYAALLIIKIITHRLSFRRSRALAFRTMGILSCHALLFGFRVWKSLHPTPNDTGRFSWMFQIGLSTWTLGAVACGMESLVQQKAPLNTNETMAREWYDRQSRLERMSHGIYVMGALVVTLTWENLMIDGNPQIPWYLFPLIRGGIMVIELTYLATFLNTVRDGRNILNPDTRTMLLSAYLILVCVRMKWRS